MAIEVFKTNVDDLRLASELKMVLLHHFPASRVNFDLQDCDRVLRIEGSDFNADKVLQLLQSRGFACSVME